MAKEEVLAIDTNEDQAPHHCAETERGSGVMSIESGSRDSNPPTPTLARWLDPSSEFLGALSPPPPSPPPINVPADSPQFLP